MSQIDQYQIIYNQNSIYLLLNWCHILLIIKQLHPMKISWLRYIVLQNIKNCKWISKNQWKSLLRWINRFIRSLTLYRPEIILFMIISGLIMVLCIIKKIENSISLAGIVYSFVNDNISPFMLLLVYIHHNFHHFQHLIPHNYLIYLTI